MARQIGRPPTGLCRSRHGIYYFRLVVPHLARALQQRLPKEIRISLRTRCPEEAQRRSLLLMNVKKRMMERLDMAVNHGTERLQLESGSFVYDVPEAWRDWFSTQTPTLGDVIQELRLLRQQIAPTRQAAIVAVASCPADPSDAITISQLSRLYCEEKLKDSWTPTTMEENLSAHRLLIEVVGDKPVRDLSVQDFSRYKQVVLRLPPNRNKDPRYRGKTIDDILRSAPSKIMSLTTRNKYLGRIRALFGWAERNGFVEKNGAIRPEEKQKCKASEARDIFTDAELQILFSREVYKSAKRARALPHHFWMPLLSVYSGARLNELCQLHTSDIREIDGIWCISFNVNGDSKSLKTVHSARNMPIHPVLLELGFLKFVDRARSRNDPRLFMGLRHKKKGGYGTAISKWFKDYRIRCGIAAKRKTFHSLRHTASDHLQQKLLPKEQTSAFLGHMTNSLAYDRYGKGYRPEAMLKIVEQLQYSIDFSHLKNSENNPFLR